MYLLCTVYNVVLNIVLKVLRQIVSILGKYYCLSVPGSFPQDPAGGEKSELKLACTYIGLHSNLNVPFLCLNLTHFLGKTIYIIRGANYLVFLGNSPNGEDKQYFTQKKPKKYAQKI